MVQPRFKGGEMDGPDDIDVLMAAFDANAIRDALTAAHAMGRQQGFTEGFTKGQASMRDSILRVVGNPSQPVSPPLPIPLPVSAQRSPEADSSNAEATRRAPKGLTRSVIDEVLRQSPGLTAKEIGELAALVDERVSPKTIYNVLKLQGDHYLTRGDRWYLRANETPILGTPQSSEILEGSIFG